jgi:methionyl-tRNA synthetase
MTTAPPPDSAAPARPARPHGPPADVAAVLAQLQKPSRVVVTAGMPYANGPLHLGHLGGTQVPADIYSRYMGMWIGRENVLFVCGSDDHGSTTEVAAMKAGKPTRALIDEIHGQQAKTLARYGVALDVFTGTSSPECFPHHAALAQNFLRKLHKNKLLEKRSSMQWFDPKAQRFLPDRLVKGICPHCGNDGAYSDECDRCGKQYEPTELKEPKSAVSDAVPEMRETKHWFLDMAAVAEPMRVWLEGKKKTKAWRSMVIADTLDRVTPSLRFDVEAEPAYLALATSLPKHKRKTAPGKKLVLQFEDKAGFDAGRSALEAGGVATAANDDWAHRSITRDIAWGIPVPADVDAELAGKTLYVWPDSLIAPISFSRVALQKQNREHELDAFWRDPKSRIVQFLGQDNIFFYVLMQGALWLGTQDDPQHLPRAGELQMTEIVGCCHLLVNGEKMSKTRGNFFTGDQLLDDMGYTAEQVRYFLALLDLSDKSSDFEVKKLAERNIFLGGKMNAVFERPVSAAHKKFDGRVPPGKLLDKVEKDTVRIVQRYVKAMERAEYPGLLFEIENYARLITSLFVQHKPHDDRMPMEARQDALFSGFYVLKNLMIMLYPFVPETMERLRETLLLPKTVFRLAELGTGLPAGHELGALQPFFPAVFAEGDDRPHEDDDG